MVNQIGKVAVLMGGFSAEREVSLLSGQAVLQALKNQGVDAHAFDPAEQALLELKKQNFQIAFNLLHGSYGEDGTIQGALETLGIAYTGCGVLASALGMDKYRSKLLWQALSLPVPAFAVLNDDSDLVAVAEHLGLPLFIKPAAEGSSVGVYKVKSLEDFQAKYQLLRQQNLHGEIIAEQNLSGGEYTCGVLNRRTLPSVRIVPKNEFYDYDAKYLQDDTEYWCPSGLNAEKEAEIQQLALQAFEAIGGGSSYGRVDFLCDEAGKLHILEVNTLPGMTKHSLIPKAAAQLGLTFEQLCLEILNTALNKE